MSTQSAKSIVLASRRVVELNADNFRLETTTVGLMDEGQVVITALYLSLDPYMRGRMSDAKSYAEAEAIGEAMSAETAGVVIESKSDLYTVVGQIAK
jgi:NADPH-dependent curcumin reductase CurA